MSNNKLFGLVREVIDNTVIPQGFGRSDPDLWVRNSEWRTDRVELVRRKATKSTFFINLHVVLPPNPGSGLEFASLAVINLPATAGESDTAYYLSDDHGRLLARMRKELANVKKWFAQFDSPQNCLEYLKDSSGRNPLSPAYKHCLDYLLSEGAKNVG